MSNDSNEDRKIIIDEDWKSQVEQEREELKSREGAAEDKAADTESPGAEQLPEATFAGLVTTLATQAMVAMGQVPDPTQSQPVMRLELARHFIDTLGLLEKKTKGNLDPEEAVMLDQVLHQLRLLFVEIQKASTSTDAQTSD